MTNDNDQEATVAWLFLVKDDEFSSYISRYVSVLATMEEAAQALTNLKTDIVFDRQWPLNQAQLDALRRATRKEDEAVFSVNMLEWQNSGVRIDT